MEYTGQAEWPRSWKGLYTGARYLFGGSRRVGYVDIRDGLKFLTPRQTNEAKPVFRLYRGQRASQSVPDRENQARA